MIKILFHLSKTRTYSCLHLTKSIVSIWLTIGFCIRELLLIYRANKALVRGVPGEIACVGYFVDGCFDVTVFPDIICAGVGSSTTNILVRDHVV